MINKAKCPKCNAEVEITREWQWPRTNLLRVTYTCGHTVTKKIKTPADINLHDKHGHQMYPFQKVGAAWAIRSGGRVAITDEMGLGKTIQAQAVLMSDPAEYLPALIVVKSGLRIQWFRAFLEWCGLDNMPQIIEGENDELIPGVKNFIVSISLLAHNTSVSVVDGKVKTRKRGIEDVEGFVKRLGIKTLVLDECQAVKNHDAKCTNAVRRIAANVPYMIALSGTPIKNNVMEYFPILNMLRPDKVPGMKSFQARWVETYWDGYKQKVGGLKDAAAFQEFTKDIVLRRTRQEVMPELPVVTRNPMFSELGPVVDKAYKEVWKDFYDYYSTTTDKAGVREANILAYLSKMRHLTGLAKVENTVEFVKDFCAETDRKIAIFVHHKDVGQALKAQLSRAMFQARGENYDMGDEILELTADMNSFERNQALERFAMGRYRVIVLSTGAAAEGLNMQFCSDFIMLERQWNPANEEQAEGRFVRIGQIENCVTGTYMIAVGTVDEFFNDLVEKKRAMMASVLDGKQYDWKQVNLVAELAEILASKGGKKWGW